MNTNQIDHKTMSRWQLDLLLGALDSLGVALSDHDHEWTEGERCIYESAVECVIKAEPTRPVNNHSPSWLGAVKTYTKKLTDEQRLIFWHRLQSGYCRECGRHKSTEICYCIS